MLEDNPKLSPKVKEAIAELGLSPMIVRSYTYLRVLDDGRLCGIHRLVYHWTMHVAIDETGYEDRYCYDTEQNATNALINWDGTNDPVGWHRHPKSGRRRNKAGEEWVNF